MTRLVRKVAADLWSARGRAALVVLAMTTGLFAVAMVGVTRALLGRELRRSFAAITPASATIRTDPAPDSLLAAVARVPGVALVDGGRLLGARTRVGDAWRTVLLFTVADYRHIAIDRLRPQRGAWPPAPGTVLLERAAVRVAGIPLGDSLAVVVGKGAPVPLAFAGTVHDFSQAPAWQEGVVYGYVDRATMARLAGSDGLTEIRIVAERATEVMAVRAVAQRVAREVERLGVRVREVRVPPPGEHPHQSQMDALLGIQLTFGAAALLLSGALVVVLLDALLVQHRRQIGAMKAIGATRGTVVRMYALWVLALAGAALAVALPAGVAAGRAYARFIADMLNFDVASDAVPPALLLALVALGGLLPMAVALRPTLRAAAMTTRDALSEAPPGAPLAVVRLARGRSPVGRLAALGVGNAMRARGRFALVVATLSLGGALFLAALGMGASFRATLAATVARLGYDLALDVSDGTPADSLALALRGLPNVARLELRPATRAFAAAEGDDPAGFPLVGARPDTLPAALAPLAGRWLAAGDEGRRVVVANHVWLARHPGYAIGDSLPLRVGGVVAWWRLVGSAREVMAGPALYAPPAVVEAAAGGGPLTRSVQIVARDHAPDAVRALGVAIERALAARGIGVARLTDLRETQQHRDDHVVMIVSFLLAMASLSQLVGGLGLATMLGVSVIERSRELGVVRAIGATRRQLLVLVVVEGAWIAAAGYLGSVVLALPATWALDVVFGRMMLGMPLELHVSPGAAPALAVVAGVIALVASGVPAWRASTRAPRELLAAT